MVRTFLILFAASCIPLLAEEPEKKTPDGRKLRETLVKPTSTDAITAMPLDDVLAMLAKRHDIKIVIDAAAFAKDLEVEKVGQSPVDLPPLKGVSLHTTLRLIAGRVGGAIVQQGDQVWLVPPAQRVPRMMKQKVDVDYKDVALGKALQDLRERTGGNVDLDPGLGLAGLRLVTVQLKQVRFDSAVMHLAQAAQLQAVLLEDELMVTTPQRAPIFRQISPPR